MQWQYQTLLIEFQKDGLLGDKYIDDEAAENLLNKMGAHGWELVNVAMIEEGLLAFCKRPREVADNEPVVNHQQPDKIAFAGRQAGEKSEPVSAALLQQEESEHIRQLEMKRRRKMSEREQDSVGGIKIS
jgi:hypothetical protein